ncbi:MAG: excinuclease ABC subunit UvrA, partial [Planctomycetaceae bacterium]
LMKHRDGTKLVLLAPQEVEVGQKYDALWERLKGMGFARVRVNGTIHRLEDVPQMDRRRRHEVDVVVDRVTIRKGGRARLAESVEAAFDLGRGMVRVAHPDDDRPEPNWKVERFSLFRSCPECGRSFEELSPHNFSFNSPLGWCRGCEGLGTQQGTNLAALVAAPHRTLSEGAVTAWPDPQRNALFGAMLDAMAQEEGVPLDVPFNQLDPRHQRLVLYGTGEKWFELQCDRRAGGVSTPTDQPADAGRSPFMFQYKGLYPAIEEASRVSYVYRQKLYGLTGEAACSVCSGGRLRGDAAAVRFHGKTLHQLCELPLGEALAFLKSINLRGDDRKVAGDLLKEATGRLNFLVDVGLNYLTLSR